MEKENKENYRMDCPLCGFVDGTPYKPGSYCYNCAKDLYNDESNYDNCEDDE
jgi:hypothetical protein